MDPWPTVVSPCSRLAVLVAFFLLLGGCGERKIEVVVVGGSMFPSLKGACLSFECAECQFPFTVEADGVPKQGKCVCPNCGFSRNLAEHAHSVASEKMAVTVSKEPFTRWQTVCFHEREREKLLVKRIAGMPGERIEIRDGFLWVDGKRTSRTDPQSLIHVFDSHWQPAAALGYPNRLATVNASTGWLRAGNQYVFAELAKESIDSKSNSEREDETTREWDWLRYQHWRGFAHHAGRFDVFPIKDSYGFNQNISRKLHMTHELLVVAVLNCGPQSSFRIRSGIWPGMMMEFDRHTHQVRVWPDFDNAPNESRAIQLEAIAGEQVVVSISTIGGIKTLCLNEVIVAKSPQAPTLEISPKSVLENNASPFSVGATEGTLKLRRLTIKRGIYYFWPEWQETSENRQVLLGEDEYFLLGDNVPVSRDSRHFEPAGIRHEDILGTIDRPE